MHTDAFIFDRRAIMQEAWAIVRRFIGNGETLRALLARALKSAWWTAKSKMEVSRRASAAKAASESLSERSVVPIREEITALENRTRLGTDGLDRLNALRHALATAEAREIEQKRALIAKAKGRFCRVVFTKKDGTQRRMTVQPAALKFHVKGEDASEAGRKAAASRAERHPHLMPVWDAEKKAPRSINLATVSQIIAHGQTYAF